ncbi:helix-turn-helix transcriptional regulator [Microbispora rosea]|uniref:helix-turn-helix transcriptional regulator n=1 Tax=Microbispora rosea TaxID=58117 RepID=UPI0037AAF142
MSDKRIIGDLVAERRKSLALTQAGLASLAGISRGTVRNIETGTVEPNDSTWERLEPVLGWATGSMRAFQQGDNPIEVLPRDALSFVLGTLTDAIENEWTNDRAQKILTNFKEVINHARGDGSLSDEDRIALTDLVDSLEQFADEEQIEAAQKEITEWFRSRSVAPRMSLREVEQLNEGDQVVHANFGPGEVIWTSGAGEKRKIKVAFQDGEKTLLPRYAPLVIVKSSATGSAGVHTMPSPENRTELNMNQLGDDIAKLLREGYVIDYHVTEPANTQNVAMVTLLFRKGPGALSSGDRYYISNAMNAPASPELTLRLSDGSFVRVNIKPKPKSPSFGENSFPDDPPF